MLRDGAFVKPSTNMLHAGAKFFLNLRSVESVMCITDVAQKILRICQRLVPDGPVLLQMWQKTMRQITYAMYCHLLALLMSLCTATRFTTGSHVLEVHVLWGEPGEL